MSDDTFVADRIPIVLRRRKWQIDVRAEFPAINQSFQAEAHLLIHLAGGSIRVVPGTSAVPCVKILAQMPVTDANVASEQGAVGDKSSQIAEDEMFVRQNVGHRFNWRNRLISAKCLEGQMPRLADNTQAIA